MKKQLIVLAGLTAMFAACTNEDVLENYEAGQALKSEGITFSIAEGVESRGDFKLNENGQFVANWNAEFDEIKVAYYGANKGTQEHTPGAPSYWNTVEGATRTKNVSAQALYGSVATYKATKTSSRGEFTSVDSENRLTFTTTLDAYDNVVPRPASFRIFRGGTTTSLTYTTNAEKVESMVLGVQILSEQSQEKANKAPFDNFVMVSDPIEGKYSADYAVGESLELSFERAFAGLAIKTTGYDKNVYGALQSVKVKMGTSTIAGNVDLQIANKVDGKWAYGNVSAPSDNVTTTIGAEWNDNYHAFMQILPVDRSKYLTAETYTVTLSFAKGDVVVEKTTSKNWVANGIYTINVDLNEATDYLLKDNALTVIKAMPALNASKQIVNTTTSAASITHFTSKVALSAADLKVLKDEFTGVVNMTLANDAESLGEDLGNIALAAGATVTLTNATIAPVIKENANLTTLNCPAVITIPAEAYKGNTTIAKYNFPKVQTIGANAFEGNTQISRVGVGVTPSEEQLVIGTYVGTPKVKASALTTIGDKAFKSTSLEQIDAPAVTTLEGNPFDSRAGSMTHLLLSALDWNTVGQMTQFLTISNNNNISEIDFTGTLDLGGNSLIKLNNKPELAKVILGANANIGAAAFMGANNTAVEFVNLDKVASVGESAFEDVVFHFTNVNVNMTVAEIGKNAFKNTNIVSYDFTETTTIGEGAFAECENLNNVIATSVATIEANTFEGCSSLNSIVLGATTIKTNSLKGLASQARITFTNVITLDGTPFGVMTATDSNDGSNATTKPIIGNFNYTIDVNDSQTGVSKAATNGTILWKTNNKYYKATFNGGVL